MGKLLIEIINVVQWTSTAAAYFNLSKEQPYKSVHSMEEYAKPMMLCKVCNKACSVVAAKEM